MPINDHNFKDTETVDSYLLSHQNSGNQAMATAFSIWAVNR